MPVTPRFVSARIFSVRFVSARRFRVASAMSIAVALILVAVSFTSSPSRASTAPAPVTLGTASTYTVFASGAVTLNSTNVLSGNVSGSAVSGSGTEYVSGRIDVGNAAAAQAQSDVAAAYNQAKELAHTDVLDGDLAGRTITPGIYYSVGALALTSQLTFDARGNSDAYFVIQVNAALTTSSASSMVLANGAQSSHIFWQTVGAIDIGGGSFLGTMLSNGAITVGASTALNGGVLTWNGAATVGAGAVVTPIYADPLVDTVTVSQGAPVSFNVLTNDAATATGAGFSLVQLSLYPQLIGDAAGPAPAAPRFGSVTCSYSGATRGLCTYQSASSFAGVDGFDYALTQKNQQWNVHVTITVTANTNNPIVREDRVVATVGGPSVSVAPLANDTAPDGATLTLTAVTALPAADGTLQCSNSVCTYTPPASGFTGTAAVTYTVSSSGAGSGSGSAAITIFVDPAPLVTKGFTASSQSADTVSLGSWSATSVVTSAMASCVSGSASSSVSWQSAPGATTWVVQRRSSGSSVGDWALVAAVDGSVSTFVDSQVSAGQSYQWRVRPDLERWQGTFSNASDSITEPAATAGGGC